MPKKPAPRKQTKASRQSKKLEGARILIEDARRPSMSEAVVEPRRIGRQLVMMAEDPTPSKAKKNTMAPVPKPSRKQPTPPERLGDQLAKDDEPAEDGPGYFRLRMQLTDGALTVRSATFVEGPFQGDETVTPGLTYEAKIGRKRVGFGDVADPSELRSFGDPSAKGTRANHHVVAQSDYEFLVRIPADELDEGALDRLRVTLYRWRGHGPGEHIGIAELATQPKTAVERLGAISGVDVPELPKDIRDNLRAAFGARSRAGRYKAG